MNKYLTKIAGLEKESANKVMNDFAAGKLKQGLAELTNLGKIRSEATYLNGMKRGNAALAKKHNITIMEATNPIDIHMVQQHNGYTNGYAPNGSKVVLHHRESMRMPSHAFSATGRPVTDMEHEAMIRHEIFELKDLDHKVRSVGTRGKDSGYLDVPNPSEDLKWTRFVRDKRFLQPGGLMSQHQSPRVLTRESNMVRENPYLLGVKKLRHNTREDQLVQRLTGSRYGMDKIHNSSHRKAYYAKPDNIYTDPNLGDYKEFHVNAK